MKRAHLPHEDQRNEKAPRIMDNAAHSACMTGLVTAAVPSLEPSDSPATTANIKAQRAASAAEHARRYAANCVPCVDSINPVEASCGHGYTLEERETNAYLLQRELSRFAATGDPIDYMAQCQSTSVQGQKNITAKMRTIIVNWLVEVCSKFKFANETLFLTVHIMDRFLVTHRTHSHQLQLVSVTACWMAAKYVEIRGKVPSVSTMVYIGAKEYTKEELLEMHATVVITVFPLTACTVYTLLPLVLKKDSTDPNLIHQIEYLLEITLLNYDLHLKNPVLMCATCVLLGRVLCGLPPWTSELETICTYKEDDLKGTLARIRQLYQEALVRPLKYNAVQTKYGLM